MKKYHFLLLAGLALGACKKDYSCKCTETTGGTAGNEFKTDIGKISKSDAEKNCKTLNESYTAAGQTVTRDCVAEKN